MKNSNIMNLTGKKSLKEEIKEYDALIYTNVRKCAK